MVKISRKERSPEKAKRSSRRRHTKHPPPDKPRRTSTRVTYLPFPMMPDKEPPQQNEKEHVKRFKVLCNVKTKIRQKYERLQNKKKNIDREKFDYYSKKYGKFLGELLSTSPQYKLKTTVPLFLVHRGVVRDFPIRKVGKKNGMTEEQQKVNRDKQQAPQDIEINFGNIRESKIPVHKDKKIIMVEAGDHLSNNDLNLAMKLVEKNIDNVAVVLLLIYQYNSRMFDCTKTKVLDDEEDKRNVEKVWKVMSVIDQVMEGNVQFAPYLVRSAWALISFADPNHDKFYHPPMRQHREKQRALYLKKLTDWGDSKWLNDGEKLERCHFFHLFLIMSGSQGCKDEAGIERFNLLISGERTGSLSVCYPLRNCNIVDYINLVTDILKSGKSQGMDQTRAILFLEIAILCETVWKSELPSNYRDLCRVYQIGEKKARVSLNGIGIINGVGIDDHVKRFLIEVMRLQYNLNDLHSLLDHLDARTAANVNDNIAEIGQKLNNVKQQGERWEEDKEWLKGLFQELENVDGEMNEICRNWLNAYSVLELFKE